ncbi:aminopeptidase N [gamma proteobacterium HTCC2207]|jgi:aminopeptidase N|uniref:Aminopeptidase N n=1 Tax=gamma proteobacterium HTCC2207 TaxID=314287 RepID=Q1YT72_9GAMM|nr:aminopeptidase N [gamma proteobacterium HTCC2207]
MKDALPQTIYLQDYKVSPFEIEKTELVFDLGNDHTRVTATLSILRNSLSDEQGADLVLHGSEGLDLQSVSVDGQLLEEGAYSRDSDSLSISGLADRAIITTEVLIKPQDNTTMMGLYRSRTMYCTQCEAEGFRDITYYLDRPDVMSEFTTKVIADKAQYPVLLSNGNPIERGELDGGRHFVTWHDPFKKPAYLFALVAGTLSCVDDSFTTLSGRQVALQIFVEEKDLDKCAHAMLSLKHSMRWDEQAYGREYDLDIFMIVAVDDFNMGAMENKGLNIFNTSAVLANPKTTTDAAFQRVEAIVAHEYFHNWSGNRVTCRDWFQLSLKEGFTVYRDSQFSADMNSATVKRIEDVSYLRTHQFAEDGGPMSHSVQPDAYMEINNFYTLTIYEKGAEIVGMIRTLLGADTFRQGSDLYFDRHDGQAVTIEEFVKAMEDASGRDLTQFRRWYKQSGTPQMAVTSRYDAADRTFTLDFSQSCPATPGQAQKQPFVIPVRLGLVGASGDLPLNSNGDTEMVYEVSQTDQQLIIENVGEAPVPSLLREFSAPIKLDYAYSKDQLLHLMANDSDGFNRWDAGQKLSFALLEKLTADSHQQRPLEMDSLLIAAYKSLLSDPNLDPAMVALMLQLPSEAQLHEEASVIYAEAIHSARLFVRQALASALSEQFVAVYERHNIEQEYAPDASQIGRRSLKNTALSYLMLVDNMGVELASKQFETADNMTDKASALSCLVNCPAAAQQAEAALQQFEQQYRDEALVMNLWLQVQAANSQLGGLQRVEELEAHSSFTLSNPNKIRSLIGGFCNANLVNFHNPDGSGYEFLKKRILTLHSRNPQVAARLMTPLTRWKKFPEPNSSQMREALQVIADEQGLVKDIYEIAIKSLQ